MARQCHIILLRAHVRWLVCYFHWRRLISGYPAIDRLSSAENGYCCSGNSDIVSVRGNGVNPCEDSRYYCYGITNCDFDASTHIFTLNLSRIVSWLTANITGTMTSSKAGYTSMKAYTSLSSSSTVPQATASSLSSSVQAAVSPSDRHTIFACGCQRPVAVEQKV